MCQSVCEINYVSCSTQQAPPVPLDSAMLDAKLAKLDVMLDAKLAKLDAMMDTKLANFASMVAELLTAKGVQ